MTYIAYIIWILVWFIVMGVPNYLFGKGLTDYTKHTILHSLWFIFGCVVLYVSYKDYLLGYFADSITIQITSLVTLSFLWLFVVPVVIEKWDLYQDMTNRYRYNIVKVFEVLLQQLCLLSGYLAFDLPWYYFALIFFIIHTPVPYIIPKRLGFITMIASLPGGALFALLYSLSPIGFFLAFGLHLAFYACMPFYYLVLDKKPIQR